MSYKVFFGVGRLLAVWMMRQSSDLQTQRVARFTVRARCDIRVCVCANGKIGKYMAECGAGLM